MYKADLQNYTVNINSKDRINFNDPSSIVKIQVRDLINLNSRKATYLSVPQIIIPPTINNISASIKNNTLEVIENTVPPGPSLSYTITFPDGNYNQTTFSNQLVSLLNAGSAGSGYAQTYNTSYDTSTGKMTVFIVGLPPGFVFSFSFNGFNGTIGEMLGFPNHIYTDVSTSSTNSLTGPNVVNFAYPQAIFLRSNKMRVDGNYDSSSGNQNIGFQGARGATGDIFKVLPIYNNGFSSVIQDRFEGLPDQRLDISNLINSTLEFRLTDQFNNLIDLNNYDWMMTLLIQYSKEIK
jgi:hypothetical protein